MKKHIGKHLLPLILLASSTVAYAETETIISRITLITDDYIIIDGFDSRNKPAPRDRQQSSRLSSNPPVPERPAVSSAGKYDLVTEDNQHLSPYPLTEFWIDKDKSDHHTFKGIGYTHEAEITIEDGTVRKIRTLDDYIL